MPRHLVVSLIAVTGLALAACGRESQPTQASGLEAAVATATACSPSLASNIRAKINAMFTGTLRTQALEQFSAIQKRCASDPGFARSRTVVLADFLAAAFRAGQLTSGTTAQSVSGLIDDLYVFVGLPAPAIPASAFDPDGAVQMAGPSGATVVTQSQTAGVDVTPNAVNQNVLVVITRLPNEPKPLATERPQFPRFYQYETFPAAAPFPVSVLVGVCVVDPPDPFAPDPETAQRLRLAHNINNNTAIEILPAASAPFLNCASSSSSSRLGRVFQGLARILGPTPAYAASALNPGGVGGLAGGFSPFGAVDPGP